MAIPLLARGAPLPATCSETLSSNSDNQESLHVDLLAGDAPTVAGNRVLVSLAFPLQQRTPRGVARVKLSLMVDAAGALTVTVAELGADNAVRKEGLVVATAPG